MLLVGFNKIGKTYFATKYEEKVDEILSDSYKSTQDWPINYIEAIKQSLLQKEVTIISYDVEVVLCLDALNIEYTLVYPDVTCKEDYKEYWENYNLFDGSDKSKIILEKEENLEQALSNVYEWINLEDIKRESLNLEKIEVNEEKGIINIPVNKNKLTFDQLLSDEVEISEADVRELKATQNKLKVGMLLQAKSSLNRVLKLSNILDKLYDKLLERVENSLDTTDTASLMYTTEYIAKALNDTNQFIVSMINNEKIQNFFIIDNSSVINVSDDRVDLDKREKIRKAVEIVIDNIDYFEKGEYENMKDPNLIEINEENINNAD